MTSRCLVDLGEPTERAHDVDAVTVAEDARHRHRSRKLLKVLWGRLVCHPVDHDAGVSRSTWACMRAIVSSISTERGAVSVQPHCGMSAEHSPSHRVAALCHAAPMRPIASAILASLVTAVAVGGIASAIDAGTSTTISACVVKTSGAVRVVPTGTTCKRTEAPLVWNQTGPQGAPGAQGSAGSGGIGRVYEVTAMRESDPLPSPLVPFRSDTTVLAGELEAQCAVGDAAMSVNPLQTFDRVNYLMPSMSGQGYSSVTVVSVLDVDGTPIGYRPIRPSMVLSSSASSSTSSDVIAFSSRDTVAVTVTCVDRTP